MMRHIGSHITVNGLVGEIISMGPDPAMRDTPLANTIYYRVKFANGTIDIVREIEERIQILLNSNPDDELNQILRELDLPEEGK